MPPQGRCLDLAQAIRRPPSGIGIRGGMSPKMCPSSSETAVSAAVRLVMSADGVAMGKMWALGLAGFQGFLNP